MNTNTPKIKLLCPFFIFLSVPLATIQAEQATPDFEREQRLMDQVVDGIFDGEVIELSTTRSQNFQAVYFEAEEDVKGAVIILHNRGFHFDWEDVTSPLRLALPEQGWTSLSVQMPVLGKEATYYDYVPIFPYSSLRIAAAIDFLQDEGYEKIVLLGHGCGVHMSVDFINANGDGDLAGFVGIGMDAIDLGQTMQASFPFPKMSVPVLDIYGGNDFPAVLRKAPERKKLAAKLDAQGYYTQKSVSDAEHYFYDDEQEEALIEAVGEWFEGI